MVPAMTPQWRDQEEQIKEMKKNTMRGNREKESKREKNDKEQKTKRFRWRDCWMGGLVYSGVQTFSPKGRGEVDQMQGLKGKLRSR